MARTRAPHAPVLRTLDAPLVLVLEAAVPLVVATACTPNVVPVTTCPFTVVVMVAATGLAVVVLQPLHVPVHDEKGPQPPVHVVNAQLAPPKGFLEFQPLPGPPHWPPFQPLGAPGRAVEHADTHELQPPLLPQGPPPGPAVIWDGQAEPPDVAEKVASGEAVTDAPAFAQS